MVSETRYMVNVTWTVNGLTAYKLKNVLDEGLGYALSISGSGSVTVYWGIRVWKRDSNGNETEVTGGTPVAQVSRDADGSGVQSNTWTCPQTALASTDAIVVRPYMKIGTGDWIATPSIGFITEQLGASQLDNVTWTVYYYTERAYDSKSDSTTGTYGWGDPTYYSRITNFSWTPPAPPVGQQLFTLINQEDY